MASKAIGRGRRRTIRKLALVLTLAVGVAVALIANHRLGPKHLLTVWPGVLYRSGVLLPWQLDEVIDRYGIRSVVNLRSQPENEDGDWYREQTELLSGRGVELVDLPMYSGYPPKSETLSRWLALLDDDSRLPALVHCQHGVVRTGMLIAVFQMEYLGYSNAQAQEALELFGQRELDDPVGSRVKDFIAGYVPRSPGRDFAEVPPGSP